MTSKVDLCLVANLRDACGAITSEVTETTEFTGENGRSGRF